ncbi:hypothetical protein Leryth_021805 [Lithospermum erythrorhizon]|nr:hypothetical protein Leryth_021805 [Lithospermum erythrorhizon]
MSPKFNQKIKEPPSLFIILTGEELFSGNFNHFRHSSDKAKTPHISVEKIKEFGVCHLKFWIRFGDYYFLINLEFLVLVDLNFLFLEVFYLVEIFNQFK